MGAFGLLLSTEVKPSPSSVVPVVRGYIVRLCYLIFMVGFLCLRILAPVTIVRFVAGINNTVAFVLLMAMLYHQPFPTINFVEPMLNFVVSLPISSVAVKFSNLFSTSLLIADQIILDFHNTVYINFNRIITNYVNHGLRYRISVTGMSYTACSLASKAVFWNCHIVINLL